MTVDIQAIPPPSSPLPTSISCDPTDSHDPPPPYPSRERRLRTARSTRRHRLQASQHTQLVSTDSHSDHEAPSSPQLLLAHVPFPAEYDAGEPTETTPFLSHLSPISTTRRLAGRPRSHSYTSITSLAPSLGQTVFSLFRTEDESDFDDELEQRPLLSPDRHDDQLSDIISRRRHGGFFSKAAWGRYFRPLVQLVYYRSLFHLLVLNFPYALAAWVFLFVFTVAGTTLLMALPLGAVLCFFNLLGARAFARGELDLQTRFHSPLAYPPPYPPRPIFTRNRDATATEVESGTASPGGQVPQTSFYKNSYAMFTDPTSYQALFYFLVIKPSITLIFSLLLLIFIVPALVLVLPAPAALRAVRRLGAWQANIAIEGLYLAVR